MVDSLIEHWFPARTVGAESIRERAAFTALPPPFALHVWWARRPLIASRAAVLASVLPAWPNGIRDPRDLPVLEALEKHFPEGERQYHAWFVRAIGITGDPVAAQLAIAAARSAGTTTENNAYGYERAFKASLSVEDASVVSDLITASGRKHDSITVGDPFAGGGSIPLETARLGFIPVANELNPVASAILAATVTLPAKLGEEFAGTINRFGQVWVDRVRSTLRQYFPVEHPDEKNAFIWAHSVPCPTTGHPTPLAPNFWLTSSSGPRRAAISLDPDPTTGELNPRVVFGDAADLVGDAGTLKRGAGLSVWDASASFDTSYVRQCAADGKVGYVLLAVSSVVDGRSGREFRAPGPDDLDAVNAASRVVEGEEQRWAIEDLVPTEALYEGQKLAEPLAMGIRRWSDFFTPRQLLANVTILETMRGVLREAHGDVTADEHRALSLYFSLVLDKCVDYNSRQSTWERTTERVKHAFANHNFAFKASFAELDGAHSVLPWALSQIVSTYKGTARLSQTSEGFFKAQERELPVVSRGSATGLPLGSRVLDAVVTDPPYYDNVMYAELSDFFYVWQKRALIDSWPEFCDLVLADKESEAVANPSLFVGMASGARGTTGPTAGQLADRHYEELLAASFAEALRVLKDDGVMTVMFTHKRVDAWDTLGAALLTAGFEISSSWPVHTESEHSLHQARQNSASSTILLGCRKRASSEPAYWEDIRGEVERAAEEAAHRFSELGIKGVDLTLATYGPALSVLSRNWPVYTGNLDANGEREVIRPDVALDLARGRVALLKKRELLAGRDVDFDRATDWWLLAWNDFQAAEFPAGEALKLCIAMDLDLEDVAKRFKLVKATAGKVTLQTPAQRRTAKALDPDAGAWPTMVDALHALMLIHDEEGMQAADRWLIMNSKKDDERFNALVEAAIHAVPRARDNSGEFARPEARILESLRSTLFDHIEDPDVAAAEQQTSLFEL